MSYDELEEDVHEDAARQGTAQVSVLSSHGKEGANAAHR